MKITMESQFLIQIKKSKSHYFNSSNKKRFHHSQTKKLLFFLFCLSITIFLYIISSKIIIKKNTHTHGQINNNITKFYSRNASSNITLSKETYTTIVNGENVSYLTKEMIDKYNLFINNCINDTLIDQKKYPLVENPKISAIMPIYNGGKYLHYSLRSIQNLTFYSKSKNERY